jgi:hypothetical protein
MSAALQMEVATLKNALRLANEEITQLKGKIDYDRATLEWKDKELEEFRQMATLRGNLDAFSDSLHLMAGRLEAATNVNPNDMNDALRVEAKALHSLADQLLTVIGLTPRDVRAA